MPAFIGAALVVILGAKYIWLYVVFQALVGIGLAAYKVTVGLNVLGRWSLPNLPTVTSLLLWAFAFAGTIGPIIGWWTLTIQGDVPIQSNRTDEILGQSQKAETEEILGVFFFVMAGIALLGFLNELRNTVCLEVKVVSCFNKRLATMVQQEAAGEITILCNMKTATPMI